MRAIYAFPCLAVGCAGALAQPVTSTAYQVAGEYAWGYRAAVKQPLGSYSLGRTVYNISRLTEGQNGSPDQLVWVDEHTGDAEIIDIGRFDGAVENPGGMVDFDDDGRIWFVYAGRAYDLPFNMVRSTLPYDPASFDLMLEDFVHEIGSTTPCYQAFGSSGLLVYRYGSSSWCDRGKVRTQRYDTSGLVPVLEAQTDIASGSPDSEFGCVGIEQLWTRYDPRVRATAVSWQWWQVEDRLFGSNSFVFTEDGGVTWRTADGAALQTPVAYTDRTPTLVPFDHIAEGVSANWNPRDVGWAPDGTPWLTLPDGHDNAVFWRWDGDAWAGHTFAGPVRDFAKPYACGTTRDYLVIAYEELAAPGALMVITSRDGGLTWSDPILADQPPSLGNEISWVVFVQPSDRYLDNAARFIYGYYRGSDYNKSYRNAVRMVRVQAGPRADFNADTAVDTLDLLAYLGAWAAGHWTADFNDDGAVDTTDVLAFLGAFADER